MAEGPGGRLSGRGSCRKCGQTAEVTAHSGVCAECESQQRRKSSSTHPATWASGESRAKAVQGGSDQGTSGTGGSETRQTASTPTASADSKPRDEEGKVKAMVKKLNSTTTVSYRMHVGTFMNCCIPGRHAYSTLQKGMVILSSYFSYTLETEGMWAMFRVSPK